MDRDFCTSHTLATLYALVRAARGCALVDAVMWCHTIMARLGLVLDSSSPSSDALKSVEGDLEAIDRKNGKRFTRSQQITFFRSLQIAVNKFAQVTAEHHGPDFTVRAVCVLDDMYFQIYYCWLRYFDPSRSAEQGRINISRGNASIQHPLLPPLLMSTTAAAATEPVARMPRVPAPLEYLASCRSLQRLRGVDVVATVVQYIREVMGGGVTSHAKNRGTCGHGARISDWWQNAADWLWLPDLVVPVSKLRGGDLESPW